MQAKLLGIQRLSFLNDKGETIKGTNIFTAFKDSNVEGLSVKKFFVSDSMSLPKDIQINDMLHISFNYKGRIEGIVKA